MVMGLAAKCLVGHDTRDDLLIALQSRQEQFVKDASEEGVNLPEIVRARGLSTAIVGAGSRSYQIEKQLLGLGKIGTESFIQFFPHRRQAPFLVLDARSTNVGRSLE